MRQLLNVLCNCLLWKSDFVYLSSILLSPTHFVALWRQGLTISSPSEKGLFFLANTDAILLDASSIAKHSQLLLTKRFCLFLYPHFFLIAFFFRSSELGTNFCFSSISTWCFLYFPLRLCHVLSESVLSKTIHIGFPEGLAMNRNSFFRNSLN